MDIRGHSWRDFTRGWPGDSQQDLRVDVHRDCHSDLQRGCDRDFQDDSRRQVDRDSDRHLQGHLRRVSRGELAGWTRDYWRKSEANTETCQNARS